MDTETVRRKLRDIYETLLSTYGPQHWWPGDSPFEVMVGAILTQAAAWTNVEKAIANLKAAGALSPRALREMSHEEIAGLVYSSGYYNAKAVKLKAIAQWLGECCGDDIETLSRMKTDDLRRELLGVWGIGEETADSIILYAANQPVFVIDAYTRRIVDRLGLSPKGNRYADYQALFTDNLTADARLFNEYHALLVCLGKNVCKRRPLCAECCLKEICHFAKS